MRTARIKEDGSAYYHVMTRVIEGRFALVDDEKERFAKLLRRVEGFSGVQVLTHCELDNHIHALLYVTEREELNDEQFLARMEYLYDQRLVNRLKADLSKLREQGHDELAEQIRQKWTYRMHDLSEFMKTLKQRCTQSYNARHERKGTLWEDRFKSVLLEGSEGALSSVAAYIDLNAVRAGIVSDPKDYRFCGYSEALGGMAKAQLGLTLVVRSLGQPTGWEEVHSEYRKRLFTIGEARGMDENGDPIKPGFSSEQVKKVLDEGGTLPMGQLVYCRVRYFTDGVVLGSRGYVEDVLRRHAHRLQRRTTPFARQVKALDCDLCTGKTFRRAAVALPVAA